MRRKEERQQLKNRQRNGTRTLSLPLFKEEMQQLEEGEGLGRKPLSLPLFNADGNSMGRALVDETTPAQTGCGLGMAHHYHTLDARNKA